ncbi:NAD(P)-dependent oxidoreductase [Pedobacter sp. UC225_65]|uniref:NAD(P)-dependent oxidoreductase n=1 Tax=Pedobacter sp. UC225_65 TaxID=3350173 RepID=UPI003672C022
MVVWSIMAGGAQVAFDRVKPIFDCLGKLALHIGENGIGNTAKLAINTLLGFHAQGLAEAIVFAEKNGVKTKDLMELINNSALGNAFMKIKGEAILNDNYEAAFALKHIAKDLRLAKDEGLSSPLANTLFESFQKAEADLGEEDIISIIKKLK